MDEAQRRPLGSTSRPTPGSGSSINDAREPVVPLMLTEVYPNPRFPTKPYPPPAHGLCLRTTEPDPSCTNGRQNHKSARHTPQATVDLESCLELQGSTEQAIKDRQAFPIERCPFEDCTNKRRHRASYAPAKGIAWATSQRESFTRVRNVPKGYACKGYCIVFERRFHDSRSAHEGSQCERG